MKKGILIVCLFVFVGLEANAQSWIEKVGKRVKEKTIDKVEERIENKSEEAIESGLDKTEETVKKSGGKRQKQASEKGATKTINQDTEEENNSQSEQQKVESYTKYDFIPGDKILYFEDFSQDAIGDFPTLWTTNGGGEVKTLNIALGKWFHMNREGSMYCYTKTIDFPQNFIMEFDVIPDENFQSAFDLCFYEEQEKKEMNDDLYPGKRGLQLFMDEESWSTKGYIDDPNSEWLESRSTTNPCEINKVNHVIIWIQNRRIRIYHKGAKVLDSPTNIYAGSKFNKIRFSSWNTGCKPYISNLKVTTATPDTRSKLITEGKLVSYGIYFDVNKDIVKPESFGTLSDIAKTLKENPSVNIKIVGHTDSDGDNAKNIDLSKRRAVSVKHVLSGDFGIDDNRIQTDGKGELEPLSSNTTAENKAKNRRVEFIKL